MDIRVGQGIDIHPFGENRSLILGGVLIPSSKGLVGHSDADVLTHALMDSLLGAAGKSDIGEYFPNTDLTWKDASSIGMLLKVMTILSDENWKVINCDITLLAQVPKIAPYIKQIKEKLAQVLLIEVDRIAIKATTTEHLGFVGREEGIVASAVVLISR